MAKSSPFSCIFYIDIDFIDLSSFLANQGVGPSVHGVLCVTLRLELDDGGDGKRCAGGGVPAMGGSSDRRQVLG